MREKEINIKNKILLHHSKLQNPNNLIYNNVLTYSWFHIKCADNNLFNSNISENIIGDQLENDGYYTK